MENQKIIIFIYLTFLLSEFILYFIYQDFINSLGDFIVDYIKFILIVACMNFMITLIVNYLKKKRMF